MDEKISYYLIACGTSDYKNSDVFSKLESVKTDIERVVDLFTNNFGYKRVLPSLDINPKGGDITNQFADWLQDEDRCETDCVIFYYSGHGEYVQGHKHYLILEDTDSNKIPQTALATEELVLPLNNDGVKISQILFIIDTCFSQGGAGDITKFASNVIQQYRPIKGAEIAVHTIAACRAKQTAEENVFSQVLQEILEILTVREMEGGYIFPSKLVHKINEKLKSSTQHVVHNNAGSETIARFFPIIPKTLQTWEEKRYEFIDKLSCVLNKKLDHSLFLVNSFLLSSKFIEEFILDYRDLKEKLKQLSIISVANKICPLVACSEWCRQRFNNPRDKSFNPNLAKEIENWLGEVINYREGVDLNKIREFVKDSFKKFKILIQQEDLRLQIEIEPKVDEDNNTGLNNGLFSLNMNLWIASKDLPLGRFAENKELDLQADEQDSCGEMCDRLRASLEKEDFLSNLIRKARYSLPVAVKLKIEFFVPSDLFQVSWEKICFKSGTKRKTFGAEYPIFINSYERYFDPDYREIRDAIQFKKEDFWSEDNSLEPDEFCFIGTQPSLDDLERIEEEFAIAVWNRCEDDFLTKDSDIKISEWENWPQQILNLRKQQKDLEITLFWDDLYPKPSNYTRPLNTDLVE